MSDGEQGDGRKTTSTASTWSLPEIQRYSSARISPTTRPRTADQEQQLDKDAMLSIRDPDLLRAVVARRVLAGFGRVLKTNQGTVETWELSAPVEWIDAFLSHSWSTPGWLKYLVLLYRTNGMLATIVAILVHVAVHGAEFLGLWQIPHFYLVSAYLADGARINEVYIRLHYLFALVAFWVTLLFGHCAPFAGRQGLFLDKVCIHQCDPVKKQAGIQMLGAFLRRSKCMLVLWQPAYFERTWCVFELAAFLHMNRADERGQTTNANIIFLPLKLPLLAMGLNVFHTLTGIACGVVVPATLFLKQHMEFVATLNAPSQVVYVFFFSVVLGVGLYAVPAILLWPYVREHLADRRTLLEQLRNFTFEDTKCFSPEDRVFVRSKVEEWFGSTEKFDAYVRDWLTRRVSSTIFQQGPIPYRFVVFGSLPHLFLCSSAIAEAFRVGDNRVAWQSLVFCANLFVVADAIAMAFVLRLGAATLDSPAAETVWVRRLAGPAATAFIFAVPTAIAAAAALLTVPLWVAVVAFAVQALTVAYLYRGGEQRTPEALHETAATDGAVAQAPVAENQAACVDMQMAEQYVDALWELYRAVV